MDVSAEPPLFRWAVPKTDEASSYVWTVSKVIGFDDAGYLTLIVKSLTPSECDLPPAHGPSRFKGELMDWEPVNETGAELLGAMRAAIALVGT